MDNVRFFGIGNETKNTEEPEYYRSRFFNYYIKPHINLDIVENFSLQTGFILKNVDHSNTNENTLLDETEIYGKNNFTLLTLYSELEYDSRDGYYNPKSGLYFNFVGEYTPKLFNLRDQFGKISFQGRYYYSSFYFTDFTLAFRLGYETTFGEVPFFEFPYLGGSQRLRGYRTYRFIGPSALWFAIENRFKLFDYAFIVPAKFGGTIYSEAGRIFSDNNDSVIYHPAIGIGLWTSLYRDEYLVSASIAFSREIPSFYINLGYDF
jgi:outer membrane protein assembly factor BamA